MLDIVYCINIVPDRTLTWNLTDSLPYFIPKQQLHLTNLYYRTITTRLTSSFYHLNKKAFPPLKANTTHRFGYDKPVDRKGSARRPSV